MRPTLGRIVHYRAHGSPNGQHRPEMRVGIITRVAPATPDVSPLSDNEKDWDVDLCILNPTGMYFNERVPFDGRPEPENAPGHWVWPTRS